MTIKKQRTNLSPVTVAHMKVAWAIWSEVGDLDRYPSKEEAAVMFQLASEVNGIRFQVGHAELAARMEDNYYYPYEDHVAQAKAFMFVPGAFETLSFVDKEAVLDRIMDLPKDQRLGLEADPDVASSVKDASDLRGSAFTRLPLREQATVANLVNRRTKR